jgi:hypothetical protein
MKLELLTNATVIDHAIEFVTHKGTTDAEVKSGADPIAVENETQEQLIGNKIREQEIDNSSTINQVF